MGTGPLVTGIGKKYNKTGAQIALKWLVQQQIPVIPKSHSETHIKENMELFDFELSKADMMSLTQATVPAVGGGPSSADSGDCGMKQEELAIYMWYASLPLSSFVLCSLCL